MTHNPCYSVKVCKMYREVCFYITSIFNINYIDIYST